MIEKKTVSMCSISESYPGWNDTVVESNKCWDAPPDDMVPTAYHDRCMELEIERRILLEQIHKETVAEVCALRDQVHNLTLYLTEALALCPDDLEVLADWHPGLPGYAPEPEEACAACRVGGEDEMEEKA